jgi:LEA14-like dessication related protein
MLQATIGDAGPRIGRVPRAGGRSRRIGAPALALLAAGCTLLTATPPSVEVQAVQLRGVGLLDQSLAVALCVTNPNDAELGFRRVTVGVDVNGAPLAESTSEAGVRLPPRASTLVPFSVVTTVRNLGPQLLGVLRTGGVDYRLHGTVQLTGALALTLPFSRSGRLDLLAAGQDALADAAAPTATRCDASPAI